LSCSLFAHPPSLLIDFFGSPFFFFFPLSFSFFSFFLGFVSFTIVTQLILNYTQSRDRNSTKWNNRKTKKGWKPSLSKNKILHDLEQNEENGYPDPDSNKTKINYTKEHNETHKNKLKEEILHVINEDFIEMLLNMANQNVQEALKKFQNSKNKEYEKTQKQIYETIGDLNKHQSETENIINREINELR
jgi:hypothetical protein